jgi:chitinase
MRFSYNAMLLAYLPHSENVIIDDFVEIFSRSSGQRMSNTIVVSSGHTGSGVIGAGTIEIVEAGGIGGGTITAGGQEIVNAGGTGGGTILSGGAEIVNGGGTGGGSFSPAVAPGWNSASIYTSGMDVSENDIVYQANYWTQGNDPLSNSVGYGEPWTEIGTLITTPVAPDAPTGLVATAESSTGVDLYWNSAIIEGSGTVSSYTILENGRAIGETSSDFYNVGSLSASTSYSFTIEATDATGTSAQSTAAVATTKAAGVAAPSFVYSPYVDMGLPSTPSLIGIAAAAGNRAITLAFIQSSGTDQIGWAGLGTFSSDTLYNGATILSEVKAFQNMGGTVTISFGGENGTDPAVEAAATGTSAAALQAEYQAVIDRYGVNALDFDIEGGAQSNQASLVLRDEALKGLEAANPGLQISYTLPVLPTGLVAAGLNIVDTAVADGVKINVVNIMTMDYGSSVDNGGAMGTDAIDAIKATEQQLATAGLHAKIGVTPMVGINDTPGETFTLADAQQLVDYVKTDHDVVGIGMWSMDRDNGSTAGDTYAANTGSGVTQSDYEFSKIFEGEDVLCYLRGTQVLTLDGEVTVESLSIGDEVVTRFGGVRRITWLGRQSYDRRFVEKNPARLPVKITAGALGAGLPRRDLFVSPGHSMLLGETLVLARQLVNGVTITQNVAPDQIDYFNIDVGGHDCVLAEGCWSETYADAPGMRAQFHNFDDFLRDHPDYQPPARLALCAPRPEQGPMLEQALQPVLARARAGLLPGPLEGWIDEITATQITGWAQDTHHPELPVQLEICAGAQKLGDALACIYRGDLEEAGKGSGRCAFFFTLPAPLSEAGRTGLQVRRAGDASSISVTDACNRLRRAG